MTNSSPPEDALLRIDDGILPAGTAGRQEVGAGATTAGNRSWWDAAAAEYLTEHGSFLGERSLMWGPEGWTEEDLGLLGAVGAGLTALEFGCGAGQGARWVQDQGARVVGLDLSLQMVRGAPSTAPTAPLLCGDALALPFADESFDLAFSAYGAVPFVADSAGLMRELARVLRPGGRLVFSTTHPIRWAFPDVPGENGLTASSSYFDTTPYVECDEGGQVTYAEHHRTLGARVAEVVAAGLQITAIDELTWNPANTQTWGGWSPLRGRLIPGTLVISARRPS